MFSRCRTRNFRSVDIDVVHTDINIIVIAVVVLGLELVDELAEEPGDEGAEEDGVVGLAVVRRDADVADRPQLGLRLLQQPRAGADVEENHLRVAFDQPPTVTHFHPARTHTVDRPPQEPD